MKKINILVSSLVLLFMLIGCEKGNEAIESADAGFLEYQYDYKVLQDGVEVTRQGFKRVNISSAVYSLYEVNPLIDSLKNSGLRQVELYLYSKECNPDSLPAAQPIGASMIKVTLVDTLGLDANTERIWHYSYYINTLASIAKTKKPVCLGMECYMNMQKDTVTQTLRYENSFMGQTSKSVRIYSYGGGQYQILANGTANSKYYNLSYTGTIQKGKIIINP